MLQQELNERARALLDLCRGKRLKLAAAESCTGGLLAATLTEIPGSSDVFEAASVRCSRGARRELLAAPRSTWPINAGGSPRTAKPRAGGRPGPPPGAPRRATTGP